MFDAEDYGEDSDDPEKDTRYTWGLGSQYWSSNFHVDPYFKPKFGILLDMVGSENARFPYEGVSAQYAPLVLQKVWKLAEQMGYGNYFVKEQDRGITDDHYFVNTIAKIPMIDIINIRTDSEVGFGTYWHTHDDNLDVINKRTLKTVGQLVLAVVYRENNGAF